MKHHVVYTDVLLCSLRVVIDLILSIRIEQVSPVYLSTHTHTLGAHTHTHVRSTHTQ